MTVLDTHIWIWWALGVPRLGERVAWLDAQPTDALGISVISIWEVAKLSQKGRLILPFDVRTWVDKALAETAVEVLGISKDIALDANALPGDFHADPADQLIRRHCPRARLRIADGGSAHSFLRARKSHRSVNSPPLFQLPTNRCITKTKKSSPSM